MASRRPRRPQGTTNGLWVACSLDHLERLRGASSAVRSVYLEVLSHVTVFSMAHHPVHGITLQRGQALVSIRLLADGTGLSKTACERHLKRLQDLGVIEIDRGARDLSWGSKQGTLVTVPGPASDMDFSVGGTQTGTQTGTPEKAGKRGKRKTSGARPAKGGTQTGTQTGTPRGQLSILTSEDIEHQNPPTPRPAKGPREKTRKAKAAELVELYVRATGTKPNARVPAAAERMVTAGHYESIKAAIASYDAKLQVRKASGDYDPDYVIAPHNWFGRAQRWTEYDGVAPDAFRRPSKDQRDRLRVKRECDFKVEREEPVPASGAWVRARIPALAKALQDLDVQLGYSIVGARAALEKAHAAGAAERDPVIDVDRDWQPDEDLVANALDEVSRRVGIPDAVAKR